MWSGFHYHNVPIRLNGNPSYNGLDPRSTGADIVEGRVGKASVRGAGLSEAKDLGGGVVSARFFTDEELGTKKIIAVRLKDAVRGRFNTSVSGDDRSRGDRGCDAAAGGEFCNGLRIDNQVVAVRELGQSGTALRPGGDCYSLSAKGRVQGANGIEAH